MKVFLYFGNLRTANKHNLSQYDLVITTYSLVISDFKKSGPLHKIKWDRVALDEAHYIRNHKTSSAIACCALIGEKRWALSGTPVHNYAMDIYSFFKFLHHSTFSEIEHFKNEFITRNDNGQECLIRELGPLLLRRTKAELQQKGALTMPAKFIEEVPIICSNQEMEVYAKVLLLSKAIYSKYLAQRNAQHKKSGNSIQLTAILVLIIRLRQICNHPGLIDAVSNKCN